MSRIDFNFQIKYINDPKKEKAANCKYLDRDRICQNKNSEVYMTKCFRASWCTLRIKEKLPIETDSSKLTKKEKRIISIRCSLPKGTPVTMISNGKHGTFVSFDKEKMYVTVLFDKEAKFVYPKSFIDGNLTVSEDYMSLIQKDIDNAIWE